MNVRQTSLAFETFLSLFLSYTLDIVDILACVASVRVTSYLFELTQIPVW